MVATKKVLDLLERPVRVRSGVAGIEQPKALLDETPENPEPLLSLSNRHVVSARQFDRDMVVQLCRLAADLETKPALHHLPLTGKIMITAFYEPSTRTRPLLRKRLAPPRRGRHFDNRPIDDRHRQGRKPA